MRYDASRAGDPGHAPGLFYSGPRAYWRPPPSAVRMGHRPDAVRLPGVRGDGQDAARALRCQDLERELLRWIDGLDRPRLEEHSWGWLIARYRSDPYSPYREIKANTRADYDAALERWAAAIGATRIDAADHEALLRWKRALEDKGRSVHDVRQMFVKLRIVARYGVLIGAQGARDVADRLSVLRLRIPKARSVKPTEAQVMAVIARAIAAGESAFALGLSLQWWLTLRAVDVRGQWLSERDGRRWADGLTWDMIDLPHVRKVVSKTERSMPEARTWDLSPLPEVLAMLQAEPQERRVGPVIKRRDGKPYTKKEWSVLWRRFADEAGLPREVWCMDLRAGALTQAGSLGASLTELMHAAHHASPETTKRYLRNRDEAAGSVIAMRTKQSRQ